MIIHAKRQTAAFADSTVTPRLQAVLDQLATARDYAARIHADTWDFAVELGGLLTAGAATADLRWLLALGISIWRRKSPSAAIECGVSMPFAVSPSVRRPASC